MDSESDDAPPKPNKSKGKKNERKSSKNKYINLTVPLRVSKKKKKQDSDDENEPVRVRVSRKKKKRDSDDENEPVRVSKKKKKKQDSDDENEPIKKTQDTVDKGTSVRIPVIESHANRVQEQTETKTNTSLETDEKSTPRKKLCSVILANSESKSFDLACKEWELRRTAIDVRLSKSCICGQAGLMYHFYIVNTTRNTRPYVVRRSTNIEIEPGELRIGSECISLFRGNKHLQKETKKCLVKMKQEEENRRASEIKTTIIIKSSSHSESWIKEEQWERVGKEWKWDDEIQTGKFECVCGEKGKKARFIKIKNETMETELDLNINCARKHLWDDMCQKINNHLVNDGTLIQCRSCSNYKTKTSRHAAYSDTNYLCSDCGAGTAICNDGCTNFVFFFDSVSKTRWCKECYPTRAICSLCMGLTKDSPDKRCRKCREINHTCPVCTKNILDTQNSCKECMVMCKSCSVHFEPSQKYQTACGWCLEQGLCSVCANYFPKRDSVTSTCIRHLPKCKKCGDKYDNFVSGNRLCVPCSGRKKCTLCDKYFLPLKRPKKNVQDSTICTECMTKGCVTCGGTFQTTDMERRICNKCTRKKRKKELPTAAKNAKIKHHIARCASCQKAFTQDCIEQNDCVACLMKNR